MELSVFFFVSHLFIFADSKKFWYGSYVQQGYKILIVLLWLNIVHYSSLFQYYFLIYYGFSLYSSWNF